MANVTATAPAAFDYLLNLFKAAATLADITVVDAELRKYVPGTFIELTEIENHRFDIESLPWFAFQETYNLSGCVRVFRGDTDFQQARDDAWAAYQSYVMTPVIADGKRLGNIVEWVVPASANGVNEITEIGGALHTVTFAFSCAARVTV
jgi:hypothetical protein